MTRTGGETKSFTKEGFRVPGSGIPSVWSILTGCQHSSVACANKKCDMAVTVNGLMGLHDLHGS